MTLTVQMASDIRDRTHNLDLNLTEHEEVYQRLLEEVIMQNEVIYEKDKPKIHHAPYDDGTGKWTIGVGFNMNGEGARDEWRRAFGDRISFDDVYNGAGKLKEEDAMILFRSCIQIRREELHKYFRDSWHLFKANERIVIESVFYNGPGLVRHYDPETGRISLTNFSKNMVRYVVLKDPQYLQAARLEILERSNRRKHSGIQNRRNAEAELLFSEKCPIYSKPGEPLIPNGSRIRPVLGKTIIPYRRANETCERSGRYYIWRTSCDDRVRSSHSANEGKIFSVDNPPATGAPGEDYGCRCSADHYLPHYVDIVESKAMERRLVGKKSFEYFLRYGLRYGIGGSGGGAFVM